MTSKAKRALRLVLGLFTLLLGGICEAPAQAEERPLAIGGVVVLPEGPLIDGWVIVRGGLIQAITTDRSKIVDATVVATKGFIYPGFVDLHNHPIYSAFPRWSPPQQFQNRYKWRNFNGYLERVAGPARILQADESAFCDLVRFGELRALSGGTTSIHGISAQKYLDPKMPACIKGGVRHLDWISGFNGEQVGREKIGSVLDIGPLDSRSAGDLIAKMNSGEIERLIIHLAEGRSSDRDSKDEFAKLTQLGLLHGKTTIIHGTALGALEFNDMAKAGASLVWSPRSNFVLYNETTDIKTAKAKGVTIALAPDWGITGSANMLAELSYARSVTSEFTDKELFEMATAIPARMAALDRMIGAIKIGAAADLLVLKAKDPDAYRNLVLAEPQDVQLVLVGGAVRYGSLQNVSTVANGSSAPANISLVDACGEQKAIEYSPRTSLGDKLQNLLRRIRARLGDFHVAPAPLIECP